MKKFFIRRSILPLPESKGSSWPPRRFLGPQRFTRSLGGGYRLSYSQEVIPFSSREYQIYQVYFPPSMQFLEERRGGEGGLLTQEVYERTNLSLRRIPINSFTQILRLRNTLRNHGLRCLA